MIGPRRAAVLGMPIVHSLSPVLHRAAYRELGLEGWTYEAIACDEGGLPGFVTEVRAEGGWAGLSLTMPLKTVAAGLCDEVTTTLGAINTIVFDGDRAVGYNTDVDGVGAGLRELAGQGADLGRVALLGAGGTARAAIEALALAGTTEVAVHVRSPDRAADVLALARERGLVAEARPLRSAERGLPVVSTLPGPAGEDIEVDGPLLDVVYDPWPTALARSAQARGWPVVGGLVVLVGQAARQVTLMTGLDAPVAAMRAAGEQELSRRIA